ncbi:MAG: iron dependent repressor, metal binding and dimerization domain protein [Thermoanaerobaculia bacterium]|nr:iron dependent repressor, metal binding and dimerization domain protein [Thermoanaerobaculia bacterium]
MHPISALLATAAVIATLVVLFWPDRGLLWAFVRASRATERVRTEDALKHLFDCEYQERSATLQSVAGVLHVTEQRAAELLERMEGRELVRTEGGSFRLTPEGRSYALRVVRTHRLWERYLSEETGLAPERWHEEAELREHRLSPAEVEDLSARLGHPRYDPHGDPIPTRKGEIAPRRGMPLTDLAVGELAEIVHLEDEPREVYAQLVAEGLHPGMKVRVNESTGRRLTFEADAEECVLAPVLAANISVEPVSREEEMGDARERLSSLALGETAEVLGFTPTCRGPERRRMLDLGLIPGTRVLAEIRSPGGDPTGYRIRGAVIALRREQADQIQIEREPAEATA